MNIGFVGAEARKFTSKGERRAKDLIAMLVEQSLSNSLNIISGGSPLGGIDAWAEELADLWDIKKLIFKPETNQWNPLGGYGFKKRNGDIAKTSDILHIIVVNEYPPEYNGMRFDNCYHCGSTTHKKSGGCWTGKLAQKLGKKVFWHIIDNET